MWYILVLNVRQSLKRIYVFEFENIIIGKEPYVLHHKQNKFLWGSSKFKVEYCYSISPRDLYNMPEAIMGNHDVLQCLSSCNVDDVGDFNDLVMDNGHMWILVKYFRRCFYFIKFGHWDVGGQKRHSRSNNDMTLIHDDEEYSIGRLIVVRICCNICMCCIFAI